MITKRYEKRKLSDLKPYKNNPRFNEEAVNDVVESIKQTGNLDPIEVDEGGVILSGHTRLKALKRLGYTETEVLVYEGLTEEQKKKYRILANKTGEKATWDMSKLQAELDGLDFGDFDFGFDLDSVSALLNESAGRNDDAPVYGDPNLPNEPTGFNGEDNLPDEYDENDMEPYAEHADEYLMRRRVLITYMPDQEEAVREFLAIGPEERLNVVYRLEDVLAARSNA